MVSPLFLLVIIYPMHGFDTILILLFLLSLTILHGLQFRVKFNMHNGDNNNKHIISSVLIFPNLLSYLASQWNFTRVNPCLALVRETRYPMAKLVLIFKKKFFLHLLYLRETTLLSYLLISSLRSSLQMERSHQSKIVKYRKTAPKGNKFKDLIQGLNSTTNTSQSARHLLEQRVRRGQSKYVLIRFMTFSTLDLNLCYTWGALETFMCICTWNILVCALEISAKAAIFCRLDCTGLALGDVVSMIVSATATQVVVVRSPRLFTCSQCYKQLQT